jgi:hypothetical protein
MDWQQVLSLGLVIVAAAYLILARLRAGSSPACGQGCTCPREETTQVRATTPAPRAPA